MVRAGSSGGQAGRRCRATAAPTSNFHCFSTPVGGMFDSSVATDRGETAGERWDTQLGGFTKNQRLVCI